MTPAITFTVPLPASPATSLQAAFDQLFKPGTEVSAKVLQVLDDNLVRIAIADLMLDVRTQVPVQAGATLQLAVSNRPQGGIRLAVTGETAPAQPAASEIEASSPAPLPPAALRTASSPPPADPGILALAAAVQSAAPRQASLAPLFANLPVVVAAAAAPPEVRQAAAQLLQLRPALAETLTADKLKTAFRNSGLFLEATLAGAEPAPQLTDAKAALIAFRQVLSSWLAVVPRMTDRAAGSTADAPSAPATSPPASPETETDGDRVSPPLAARTAMTALSAQTARSAAPSTSPEKLSSLPASGGRPAASVGDLPPKIAAALLSETLEIIMAPQRPAGASVSGAGAELSRQLAGVASGQETGALTSALGKPAQTLSTLIAAAEALPFEWPSKPAAVIAEKPAPAIPPPLRDGAPSPQPVALPSIAPDTPPQAMAHRLLQQTDAALARQTLLQAASLPDRIDQGTAAGGSRDSEGPRWSFEIPFATPQGTAMAQFEVSRDGGKTHETASSARVWRARFTLALEPAGPIHALVSLTGEPGAPRRASVRMWAERPDTGARLRASAGELGQALRGAALEPGDITVADGAPQRQTAARAGRLLDRAT